MKTANLLSFLLLAGLLLVLTSYRPDTTSIDNLEEVPMPENVKAILDNKCFGCHNVESKGDKAKEKLLLDKINELSKSKLIATLSDIEEVAEEGTMPPEKFLEKYPDKKLSAKEQEILRSWAASTADDLLK